MSEPLIRIKGVPKSGLATWRSEWVHITKPRCILTWLIAWTAFAATAGTITLEGTNDPLSAVSGAAGNNVFTLTTASLPLWGTGFTPDANAGRTWVALEGCPNYVRMVYTRSAGGGVDQFSYWIFGG